MDISALTNTAKQMVAPGKGVLAADESSKTIKKRLEAVGVEDSEENHRLYRQMLLTAEGIEEYISGVILYDETLRQKADDGTPFSELLSKKGILPGIKVDAGAKELALHPDEKITEGLDKLRERLAEYRSLGARFAKWRAVITIGENTPSEACVFANAHAMARYAALCQEADIVPIVEPEVLMDGDHSIERCFEVSENVLEETFEELEHQNVALPGTILKASMVIAGKDAAQQASVDDVATETVRCLKEEVPPELTGIVFLSGGQSDELATTHLSAMNQLGKHPWPLSFSYGRALQNAALTAWAAKDNEKAQAALLFRSKMCSLAAQGKYSSEMEESRPY